MTYPFRDVRPSDKLYEDLIAALDVKRGPAGAPSQHDWEIHELPYVMWLFATHWEGLPLRFAENDRYRIMIQRSTLVRAYSVLGQLETDGSVTLLALKIELFAEADDGLIDPDADGGEAED